MPQGFNDNFWSLGTEGSPGGPTVEFYVDGIEVWNLVFNHFVLKDGEYIESDKKGVDTGMGLERLAAVIQDKRDVYETDIYEPIIKKIEEISGKKYNENKKAFRIIARDKGLTIEKKELERKLSEHQEKSRTASAGMFKGGLADNKVETMRLHTVAHLLLAALRQVLSPEVSQKGSNITEERLRFDFNWPEKLSVEQISEVEKIVNEKISDDLPVKMEEMSLEAAKQSGATGVFDDRYGEKVKVYSIDKFSCEICGGPHVERTGELGHFKIIKEESSSAGVRRIKAILE